MLPNGASKSSTIDSFYLNLIFELKINIIPIKFLWNIKIDEDWVVYFNSILKARVFNKNNKHECLGFSYCVVTKKFDPIC